MYVICDYDYGDNIPFFWLQHQSFVALPTSWNLTASERFQAKNCSSEWINIWLSQVMIRLQFLRGTGIFLFCCHIQASPRAHLASLVTRNPYFRGPTQPQYPVVRTLADLLRSFCDFPQFFQADAWVPQIRPCWPPPMSFLIYYTFNHPFRYESFSNETNLWCC